MNVLGISGLEHAMPFKRQMFPGLDEREYRIAQGMDSAAALLIDGKLIAAAQEERFGRPRHTGAFPIRAIQFCLQEANVSIDEIDQIAHAFDFAPFRQLFSMNASSSRLYDQVLCHHAFLQQVDRHLPGFPEEKVFAVGHHLAHAASAAYTSGWHECLVIVNDAMGEVESTSVYDFCNGELNRLCVIGANDSIGILYSLITLHLGFDFNADEYKVMGLAPYGNPDRYRSLFEQLVELRPDGTIRIPILKLNRTRLERETYSATRAYLTNNLIQPRAPTDPITSDHQDVAAALQQCLHRTLIHICGHFAQKTGRRNLALAGGVALNCTANGKLMRSGLFDEVYIQPAAGDDGASLGAALFRASLAGEVLNRRFPAPLLGPRSSDSEIEASLQKFASQISWSRLDSLASACASAAQLIADGRVIAWNRGRMEFGPRALGNRSILADPGNPEMRDRINRMVKKREAFRPFAPACTLQEAPHWFEVAPGEQHPYMIGLVNVRAWAQTQLPAVTHIDGSARLQTVTESDNSDFYALLIAVGKTTGRQMVLNTSFNVKGQPIVNSPDEAIETFLTTGIDFLFIENCLVTRAAASLESSRG
jgi:carbamoyltransferase